MSAPSGASGCGCGHPDAHADDCEGASLFSSIDLPRVRCLNEAAPGSVLRVLRPLAARAARDVEPLRSNVGDTELLLVLPLTSVCRIKSVCVSGGADGTAPTSATLWANRDDMDFTEAETCAPTQTLELPLDATADVWHPLRAAKWGAVHSLSLLLRGTHDASADASCVFFVGLKGVATGMTRRVVEAVYEARPQLSDHTARADAGAGRVGM